MDSDGQCNISSNASAAVLNPNVFLRRHITVMTMDGLAKFGAAAKSPIPDLLEPELLTFTSERGMMVCGFEETDGRRYYQGWWMQWKWR